MPDTGEKREITRFVNAKEVETIQEAKKLVSKTKQGSAKAAHENRSRKTRNVSPAGTAKPAAAESRELDKAASERMVDEGDPNRRP